MIPATEYDIFYSAMDIAERYKVSPSTAYKLIREIKHFNGAEDVGSKLLKGKVLGIELMMWEHRVLSK